MIRPASRIALLLLGFCVLPSLAVGQSIESLGWLDPEYQHYSVAFDVAPDGSWVTGSSWNAEGDGDFYWTAGGGMRSLRSMVTNPDEDEYRIWASGMSGDGNVIFGYYENEDYSDFGPCRWIGGSFQRIDAPRLLGIYHFSHDGNAGAGEGVSERTGTFAAFRWSAGGGTQEIPLPDDYLGQSRVSAISANGDVIVGGADPSDVNKPADFRPFHWSATDGLTILPQLYGKYSGADAVSADGRVVVGTVGAYGDKHYAFRWTHDEGIEELKAPNYDASALAVSADGRIVCGTFGSGSYSEACFWKDGRHRSLWDTLEAYGVDPSETAWKKLEYIFACSEDGSVMVGEGKLGPWTTAFRVVLPVDDEPPKLERPDDVRSDCVKTKTYAYVDLPKPKATDNLPGRIEVRNDAPSRFPIGKTKVTWTATDPAGNVAKRSSFVVVDNWSPNANAGPDIRITTKRERRVRVVLDGRKSSDRDEHRLSYEWKAPGVNLSRRKTPRPVGRFPIGTTRVSLKVTDAGGAWSYDSVRVIVRLKNGRRRSYGAAANDALASAAKSAIDGATSETSGSASAEAVGYALTASLLGDATGEYLRWEDGQSEADAFVSYAELRSLQRAYAFAAGESLRDAYLESGDENLAHAYAYAAFGAAYAHADLTQP